MKKIVSLLLCIFLLSGAACFAEGAEDGMFFLTEEFNRLYGMPFSGGEGVLIEDDTVSCFVRDGDTLLAAFSDGSIRRIDPSSGTSEILFTDVGHPANEILPLNDGFISTSFSMREGPRYWLYNGKTGSCEKIFEGRYPNELCTHGNVLLYIEYPDGGPVLYAYDAFSRTKLLEMPVSSGAEPCSFNGELYLFHCNEGKLDQIDLPSGRLIPVDIPLRDTDWILYNAWNGAYLVSGNYFDDNRLYLVTKAGRQEIALGDMDYAYPADCTGKYVLFSDTDYLESDKVENTWYPVSHYYVLNMETGLAYEAPFYGEYGKLFAAGDFPLMDSSTARKPVTAMIYSFFCESTGAGGSVPLCSTTHNAWLNIADRTADIALLAAPTKEEQEYLESRGVSVEMKLYGGDGLVFIGNKACGVDNLTLEQIRAVYRGEITNWAQLGGTDHEINVLYRDDQSGSQRLFERMLWSEEPVPDFEALGFDLLGDMSTIVTHCLYDPYAIGYSIMTYLNDVYGNEDLLAYSLEGFAATPENVASKNYPLSTQGFAVIRSDEPEDSPSRRLFNWFGSPLSDYILTSNGVTPLSE